MKSELRLAAFDRHVVIIDPSWDDGPSWDIPTLDQLKATHRLNNYIYKRENWDAIQEAIRLSAVREMRFKKTIAYLQPFVESGVFLGIEINRLISIFR